MTNEEIIAGNKLIGEFMGETTYLDKLHPNWKRIVQTTQDVSTYPPYHESWDWLMGVVDRIEDAGAVVEISKQTCKVRMKIGAHYCTTFHSSLSTRDAVYVSAIQFIKYHNQISG